MKTGITAWEFMLSLRPALPMSKERGGKDQEGRCLPASNGEVKRWLLNKAVVIDGKHLQPQDEVDFPVTQLVIFPKSEVNRCTIF